MTKKPRKESYRVTITRPADWPVERVRQTLLNAMSAYAILATVERIRNTPKPWWRKFFQ